MKTFYIVGSNGFLGKSLLKFFTKYKINNLKIIRIKRNLKNRYQFPKKIKENSVCINFASIIGKMCEENKNHTYQINVDLNKQLNQLNFKKIIFTSSASVYGHQSKMCNEKSITNITNFYTETKVMAEEELLKKKENLILRLATCFGGQKQSRNLNLIDSIIESIRKKNKIKIYSLKNFRPYIDINNFCKIMFELLKNNNVNGIYNFGLNELNLNKLQILGYIKKIFPDLKYDIDNDNIDKRNYKLNYIKLYKLINIKKLNVQKTFNNYYD